MNSKKEVQHVYLVGAKSLGAYGGYETFVYRKVHPFISRSRKKKRRRVKIWKPTRALRL